MKQAVGVLVVARSDVVVLLVEDRIDLIGVHELLDVDDLAPVARRGLDLVLLENDVLIRLDLIALDDLLVRDLAILLGADPAVLDGRAVLRVDLVN